MVNAEFRNRQLPYSSPLANVLVVLVGIIAIAISFVVGVFALVTLAVSAIILGIVLRIRRWWLSRHNPETGHYDGTTATAAGNTVIEGEYSVISTQKNSDDSSET